MENLDLKDELINEIKQELNNLFTNAIEEKLDNLTPDDVNNFLINLNKFQLDKKEHIKKYYKLRELHSEIVDDMEEDIDNDKYPSYEYFNELHENIIRETKGLDISLDPQNIDDLNILSELFVYKNHHKIPAITDIYIENKKYKEIDKIKMLNSMKDSYVGLFKIIDSDIENGYVTYEDVFTHKKYKIIDIAMSSTFNKDNKRKMYIYNRIINYDGISFGTGIHCIMTSDNKYLKEFIKKHKYNNCSDFSRCLMLYDIAKKEKNLKASWHNNGN